MNMNKEINQELLKAICRNCQEDLNLPCTAKCMYYKYKIELEKVH